MKQEPAENMTIAILKQHLKDKGIAFGSKAKTRNLCKYSILKLVMLLFLTDVSLSRSSFTLLTNIHKKYRQPRSRFLSSYLLVSFSDWLLDTVDRKFRYKEKCVQHRKKNHKRKKWYKKARKVSFVRSITVDE